jgi:exonuclease VII large subunit
MRTRTLFRAGFSFGLSATCLFLLHLNHALRQETVQQKERLARLETVPAENAELRLRASRQQAVEWEIETLRQQARDVHRLRAQVSELLQLRRENQALTVQINQLTNQLQQLAQQTEPFRSRTNDADFASVVRAAFLGGSLRQDSVTNR